MWTHFVSHFSVTVFTLLWGFPFLVRGQGWSQEAASVLLMAMVGWTILSGLVLGRLVTRLPWYRSVIVLGIVAVMAVLWAVVLLWPGPSPAWLLVLMCFATASGGPASMIGFDLARSFTPVAEVGRANGIVNVGGFGASLLYVALVGLVLDLSEPAGAAAYDLGDFRKALAVQFLFWAFGTWQVLRYRRRAIAHLERVHPGAVEQLKRGVPFVHPGIGEEGV